MKGKVLSFILAFLMCIGLIGCGPSASPTETEDAESSTNSCEGTSQEGTPETLISEDMIVWLSISADSSIPKHYIEELNWLVVEDTITEQEMIIDCETGEKINRGYDTISRFSEGYAVVANYDGVAQLGDLTSQRKKYGFVDKTGNIVIPIIYDYAGDFSEGLACVAKIVSPDIPFFIADNRNLGFIDKNGEVVIPLEYEGAGDFSEGLAYVRTRDEGSKSQFIDQAGRTIISLGSREAGSFSDGLARVYGQDGGYIDHTGTMVIAVGDYRCWDFSNGLTAVWSDGTAENLGGLIDKTGQVVLPLEYSDIGELSDGLMKVCKSNSGWGFVDTTGTVVIPTRYYTVGDFSQGLAPVCDDEGWAFIDKTGTKVTSLPGMESVGTLTNGIASATVNNENDSPSPDEPWILYGFIDQAGNTVLPFVYHETGILEGGLGWVITDSSVGVFRIPDKAEN